MKNWFKRLLKVKPDPWTSENGRIIGISTSESNLCPSPEERGRMKKIIKEVQEDMRKEYEEDRSREIREGDV
jgi:hypothetical protein